MIITTMSQLIRRSEFAKMESNLYQNPGIVATTALIHLLLGLLVIFSHNVWELSWRVIITLGGWGFVLKGANRLFFPEIDTRVAFSIDRSGKHSWWVTIALILLLLFNLWILYMAFTV